MAAKFKGISMKYPSLVHSAILVLVIGFFQSAFAEFDISREKQIVIKQVDALEHEIESMSMELWTYSEIALTEVRSAEFLAAILETEGFKLKRGVAGMPTAFVAEWGDSGPVIGILAEYDALPNIGNDPVPMKQARADGHAHGQGCGHNLFGAGSVGAAIALKRTMETRGIKGTVKLFGTPAEETLVGKVYMASAGVFDGIDVALDWHGHGSRGCCAGGFPNVDIGFWRRGRCGGQFFGGQWFCSTWWGWRGRACPWGRSRSNQFRRGLSRHWDQQELAFAHRKVAAKPVPLGKVLDRHFVETCNGIGGFAALDLMANWFLCRRYYWGTGRRF
jgi:hypothetical protein